MAWIGVYQPATVQNVCSTVCATEIFSGQVEVCGLDGSVSLETVKRARFYNRNIYLKTESLWPVEVYHSSALQTV